MTLPAGTRLGPFELLAPLGAGGMGEVYRARDTRLGRIVAVKVLQTAAAADPDSRLRFEREARSTFSSWSFSRARRWRGGWGKAPCPSSMCSAVRSRLRARSMPLIG